MTKVSSTDGVKIWKLFLIYVDLKISTRPAWRANSEGRQKRRGLRQLEEYRSTFAQAHEEVAGAIRNALSLEPSKRAKTTKSITDKLLRESIRLTQIQDIAGCRIVVPNMSEQDSVVELLEKIFERVTVVDRRAKPSHSYRAVHVIASIRDKSVEVQVRTPLQHIWAELSEKLSDITKTALKYGKGDEEILKRLGQISWEIASFESYEVELMRISGNALSEKEEEELEEGERRLDSWRNTIFIALRSLYRIAKSDR